MVFCGKASLSCQNCRLRRIKCNKLQPECSQCTRAGKKCPGYRDQLSLMFRDETLKVRNKFQDPEAGADSASSAAASAATPSAVGPARSPKASPGIFSKRTMHARLAPRGRPNGKPRVKREPAEDDDAAEWEDVADSASSGRSGATRRRRKQKEEAPEWCITPYSPVSSSSSSSSSSTITMPPLQTPTERGWQFYVENYIFTHRQDPQNAHSLAQEVPWLFDPATTPLAAAVGLVSLANLTGSRQLLEESRQLYLTGLQRTNRMLVGAQPQDMGETMRGIVLMAMFELVRGDKESIGLANLHVKGATALMRNFLPLLPPSAEPFRVLMQFCSSLLIPCYTSGSRVPEMVLDYVTTGSRSAPAEERPMADLILVVADLINMSSYVQHHVLVDGLAETTGLVLQARQLDARLMVWEYNARTSEQWRIEECTTALPPEACYHGRFHRYQDLPIARLWSYYRWGRILACDLLLSMLEQCPRAAEAAVMQSSGGASSAGSAGSAGSAMSSGDVEQFRAYLLQTTRHTAEDVFVSTPTYWQHPGVPTPVYRAEILSESVLPVIGGTGATGIPPLLFQLQTASCARGVPEEDYLWALNVVETIWGQLGMQQARQIADNMRIFKDTERRRRQTDEKGKRNA